MDNAQQLQKQTALFLTKDDVHAVGLFDVSVNFGRRVAGPAAVGLAAGLATKAIQKKFIKKTNGTKNTADSGEDEVVADKEYSLGNRFLTGAVGFAAAVGTKTLLEVNEAKKNDQTRIMVVAVSQRSIYLLGWKGTHNSGEITKELQKFNRNKAIVKTNTRGLIHHTVTIKEDGDSVKIECNLSATHKNKRTNRELIRHLEASSSSILPGVIPSKPKNTSVTFRWASTGGGWQSMVGNMAFANVFSKAGLINNKSSKFSAISTQSGATWFSTQFFYSPQFFDKVVNSSPSELSKFVRQWMNSYDTMYENDSSVAQKRNNCFQELFTNKDDIKMKMFLDYVTGFNEYNGNWATIVSTFLKAASTGYGDPTFVDREVGAENRVIQMLSVDLYLQTTLVPNSRNENSNVGIFLGPANDKSKIYSLPTTVQYSVSKDETLYYTTLPKGDLSMNKYSRILNTNFKVEDFEEFGTFPCENQNALIKRDETYKYEGEMNTPFGGDTPNVAQISSASSAAGGPASPLVPSTFAQALSTARDKLKGKPIKLAAFDALVDGLYKDKKLNEVSVDSQWPNSNSESDARFVDGCWTDGPTLALNIGQYQTRENGDLTTTMKVIVTNEGSSTMPISLYFKSELNDGIAPGAFLWSPNKDETACSLLPIQSPQIFDTTDNFDIQPIDGLAVTTALITATTIANPAFKTKANQLVKILLLNLNSKIPVGIFGKEQTQQQTQPLADMAKDISSNEELLRRIKFFVEEY